MKIKITVTKEILEKSKNCPMLQTGINDKEFIHLRQHCAVSEAVCEIFPICETFDSYIQLPTGSIKLPKEATMFIRQFDGKMPERRALMPELSFTIDVPESVINQIGIEEVHRILATSKTLSIVEK